MKSQALLVDGVRSAVAPHSGALRQLLPHQIGAPLLQALLARCGLPVYAVDHLLLGNALGANGNPARMVALAAGLPDRCAALSVDSQCCAGLDAVSLGVGLLASGQAELVVAGGVEAWSRAPMRLHRPLLPSQPAQGYERPAFAPDPARDPDLLQAAAAHARARGISRTAQDAYALASHARACASAAALAEEIVTVAGLTSDAYPRRLAPARAARLPLAASLPGAESCGLSPLAISPRADGAALLLLASPAACQRWGLCPRAQWLGGLALGVAPEMPLLAAAETSLALLERLQLQPKELAAVELHDAFAVQGLDFQNRLALTASRLNRRGGGLARGHPIGASAAIALVRVLADLWRDEAPGALGLAAVAGAGGLGSAALVQRLGGCMG
jgi:acetyl-CoA C-acetyltransferase